MARYTFYKQGNNVICVSHYAGKTVKGIAKCSPNDTYDENYGKLLSQLRCDIKVAEKRYKATLSQCDALDKVYDYIIKEKNEAEQWLVRCQKEIETLTETYNKAITNA